MKWQAKLPPTQQNTPKKHIYQWLNFCPTRVIQSHNYVAQYNVEVIQGGVWVVPVSPHLRGLWIFHRIIDSIKNQPTSLQAKWEERKYLRAVWGSELVKNIMLQCEVQRILEFFLRIGIVFHLWLLCCVHDMCCTWVRTQMRSWCSPDCLHVLSGLKLRSPGLLTSTFTHWAISPASDFV